MLPCIFCWQAIAGSYCAHSSSAAAGLDRPEPAGLPSSLDPPGHGVDASAGGAGSCAAVAEPVSGHAGSARGAGGGHDVASAHSTGSAGDPTGAGDFEVDSAGLFLQHRAGPPGQAGPRGPYVPRAEWWVQDRMDETLWWWQDHQGGWHRWRDVQAPSAGGLPAGPVQSGWLNKCAALVHMQHVQEGQCLQFALERLWSHPALRASLDKLSDGYKSHGKEIYTRYFPAQ